MGAAGRNEAPNQINQNNQLNAFQTELAKSKIAVPCNSNGIKTVELTKLPVNMYQQQSPY
jgi:hypothetical protein